MLLVITSFSSMDNGQPDLGPASVTDSLSISLLAKLLIVVILGMSLSAGSFLYWYNNDDNEDRALHYHRATILFTSDIRTHLEILKNQVLRYEMALIQGGESVPFRTHHKAVLETIRARLKEISVLQKRYQSSKYDKVLEQVHWQFDAFVAVHERRETPSHTAFLALLARMIRPLDQVVRQLQAMHQEDLEQINVFLESRRDTHSRMLVVFMLVLLISGLWMIKRILGRIDTMVTQLARAEEDARRAQKAAEKANQTKSAFLANMSHEIRTPLNAIIGMTELMHDADLGSEERHYLDVCSSAGETLLHLINDILDLSKVEAGRLELEMAPFNPHLLVDKIMNIFSILARTKGIGLISRVDEQVPTGLEGDAGRVMQIFFNLVGNAIKFTPEGTVSIHVGVRPCSDAEEPRDGGQSAGETTRLQVSITDTGIGISGTKLEQIFDAFSQADVSTTRQFGGTGLGLTISRQLARMMGGDVNATSRMGEGSTFVFEAPFQVTEMDHGASRANGAPSEGAGGEGSRQGSTRIEVEQPPAVSCDDGAACRILVVDDSEDNLLLVKAFLKKSPFVVKTAHNGSEALALVTADAEERGFDLILMDIQMPVMDGYETTRRIRAWERENRAGRVPIIALTAYAMSEDVQRAKDAGCDDHLTKPIRRARLISTMEGALHKTEDVDSLQS
ncbi:MAG: response regulator [Magnetococcales bacterium]|nr:response regulator [Magnetococcales bacterium]